MKKALLLALLLTLTACTAPPADEPAAEVMAPVQQTQEAYCLGIAAAANISKSMNATYDFPGYARTEVTFAAVVINSDGVICQCAIDGISATISFDAAGALQSEAGTVFFSKAALGQAYGMHKASPLGTEWYQQAADFAVACVGKTAAELLPGDAVSSVTISTDALCQAVCLAAENARQPAPPDGVLRLFCHGVMTDSRSACRDDGTPGLACLRTVASARAANGQSAATVGCAVTSAVPFSADGRLICDISQTLSVLSDVFSFSSITGHEAEELQKISLGNG